VGESKGHHLGNEGASPGCASGDRPSIREAERMGATPNQSAWGCDDKSKSNVADEGIFAKDSRYRKLRTFRT
jgi:hypothetical protein